MLNYIFCFVTIISELEKKGIVIYYNCYWNSEADINYASVAPTQELGEQIFTSKYLYSFDAIMT